MFGIALLASGCGGGRAGGVAVRVGKAVITTAAVHHWMEVLAPPFEVPDAPNFHRCTEQAAEEHPEGSQSQLALKAECKQRYDTLRRQALSYLISAQWVIGQAREAGMASSELRRSAATGPRDGPLGVGGADLRFEHQVGYSGAWLRRYVFRTLPPVPEQQLSRYYVEHQSRYERRERRLFEIVEHLSSMAAARAAMARLGTGASLRKAAFAEQLERGTPLLNLADRRALIIAVFKAHPHALAGPFAFAGHYAFFELTHVAPRTVTPLAAVRGQIEGKLHAGALTKALTAQVAAWRRNWIAKTDCSPGYLVQQCSQYRGPREGESATALG
jgi:hypothetical protein